MMLQLLPEAPVPEIGPCWLGRQTLCRRWGADGSINGSESIWLHRNESGLRTDVFSRVTIYLGTPMPPPFLQAMRKAIKRVTWRTFPVDFPASNLNSGWPFRRFNLKLSLVARPPHDHSHRLTAPRDL